MYTIDTCSKCGARIDWRNFSTEKGVCYKCLEAERMSVRAAMLEELTQMRLEDRIARLEALLYDHEDRHPGKVLWQ